MCKLPLKKWKLLLARRDERANAVVVALSHNSSSAHFNSLTNARTMASCWRHVPTDKKYANVQSKRCSKHMLALYGTKTREDLSLTKQSHCPLKRNGVTVSLIASVSLDNFSHHPHVTFFDGWYFLHAWSHLPSVIGVSFSHWHVSLACSLQ